jgi:hypothetical protein
MFARRFLEQLPPLNYNVFVYLISFERELLKYEEDNSLNAQRMAAISIGFMTRLGPLSISTPSPPSNESPTTPPSTTGAAPPAPPGPQAAQQPAQPAPPQGAPSAAEAATSAANATQLALQSLLVYFLTSQSL